MKCKLSHLAISLFVFIMASCSSSKTVNYLSYYPQDSSHTYIYQSFEVPIQPGDQLSIVVSALNTASAVPYNLPNPTKGILVEQDGRILYPQLGYIKAEGLTRTQLRDVIVNRLKTYLTDPVVSIEFLNFRVTVLGEVGTQGTLTQAEGNLNILQAIAQAGGLTVYAKKYPVRIIRENKGRREFGYVNLLSHSIFSSPYYRLQQNDIIFVESVENKPTASAQITQQRLTLITSIVAVLSTLTVLFYTVFHK